MSKKKTSSPHLVQIVQHCIRIDRYRAETSKTEFLAKDINFDAILKQIDLLGEEVSKLFTDDPDNVMKNFPRVPWAEMHAIRNRSTHNYFTIDSEQIWDYISNELPKIEQISDARSAFLRDALQDALQVPGERVLQPVHS
ncbi:MAG: DUF86 domain-containing protein [Oligoflexus sp.]|nr:DUF86 domain-containing protein [Oligoflexus sp.]